MEHQKHYFECDCIGPHNADEEGYRVEEIDGRLYAVRVEHHHE